jgi:hypothetical protein
MSRKCACNRPLFWNSTTYFPKNIIFHQPPLQLQLCSEYSGDDIQTVLRCLTRVQFTLDLIPRLQVIVRKIFGLPYLRTRAMASMYRCLMSLGPPIKDVARTVHFPIASARDSPACTLSTRPWYRYALISFWLFLMKSKQELSILIYVSTANCWKSRFPKGIGLNILVGSETCSNSSCTQIHIYSQHNLLIFK